MTKTKKRVWVILCPILALLLLAGAGLIVYTKLSEGQRKGAYERIFREHYNARVALFREENAQFEKGEVEVVFLGDSLTEGYDLATHYPQYVTVNRGIGGDTTHGVEERLQVSVYDLEPQAVVMLIGANNMDTMMENYERILIGLRSNLPNTKIILVSLTSMSGEWGKKNELAKANNVKIRTLADRYGFAYVDLFNALLDPETNEIRAEYTTDGGHQTALGYEVFTATITPVLEEALQ